MSIQPKRTYKDAMFENICKAFDDSCRCTINGVEHVCPFKESGDICNPHQYSFEQFQELFNVSVIVKQFGRKWTI